MAYRLTGLETASFTKDRKELALQFRTNRGNLTVEISAKGLSALISNLQEIEAQNAMQNPAAGASASEQVNIRSQNVDAFEMGSATSGAKEGVFLRLGTGGAYRTYFIPPGMAKDIGAGLDKVLGQLQAAPKPL